MLYRIIFFYLLTTFFVYNIFTFMLRGTTRARRTVKFWIFFIVDDEIRSVSVNFFTLQQGFENLKEYCWTSIKSTFNVNKAVLKHWCWVGSYSRAGTNPNNQVFWGDRLYSSNCLFILCVITCSWTAVWNMVKWLENYLLLCWTFIFYHRTTFCPQGQAQTTENAFKFEIPALRVFNLWFVLQPVTAEVKTLFTSFHIALLGTVWILEKSKLNRTVKNCSGCSIYQPNKPVPRYTSLHSKDKLQTSCGM